MRSPAFAGSRWFAQAAPLTVPFADRTHRVTHDCTGRGHRRPFERGFDQEKWRAKAEQSARADTTLSRSVRDGYRARNDRAIATVGYRVAGSIRRAGAERGRGRGADRCDGNSRQALNSPTVARTRAETPGRDPLWRRPMAGAGGGASVRDACFRGRRAGPLALWRRGFRGCTPRRRSPFRSHSRRSAGAAGTRLHAPKATSVRARGSLGGGAKQSFDRAVSFLNPGHSAIALALPSGAQSRPEKRCRIILCRLQDAMPPQRLPRCVRGRRIVNSVNSPGALLTAIVPPCCWVTMS